MSLHRICAFHSFFHACTYVNVRTHSSWKLGVTRLARKNMSYVNSFPRSNVYIPQHNFVRRSASAKLCVTELLKMMVLGLRNLMEDTNFFFFFSQSRRCARRSIVFPTYFSVFQCHWSSNPTSRFGNSQESLSPSQPFGCPHMPHCRSGIMTINQITACIKHLAS